MRPVQRSMIARLVLIPGGAVLGGSKSGCFRYYWSDGTGTCWSGSFKTIEQAVSAIKKAGFGRYKYGEKTVSL